MTKHPLAVVSLLAFLTGGAAAVVLNYPPRHPPASRQVAERHAGAGRAAAPETGATVPAAAAVEHAEEGTASGDFEDSAATPEEAGGGAEGGLREAAVAVEKPSGAAKARAATNAPAAQNSQAPRPSLRVSRRETAPGGGGVAAYTVGGVKKTGQGVKKAGATIGRTFGKIGGVFND